MNFNTQIIIIITAIVAFQTTMTQSKPYQPRQFRRSTLESSPTRRTNRGSSIIGDRAYLNNIMTSRYIVRRQKLRMLEMMARRNVLRKRISSRSSTTGNDQLKAKKKRESSESRRMRKSSTFVTIGDFSCPQKLAKRVESLQEEISFAEEEQDFDEVDILEDKVEILLKHGCTKYM